MQLRRFPVDVARQPQIYRLSCWVQNAVARGDFAGFVANKNGPCTATLDQHAFTRQEKQTCLLTTAGIRRPLQDELAFILARMEISNKVCLGCFRVVIECAPTPADVRGSVQLHLVILFCCFKNHRVTEGNDDRKSPPKIDLVVTVLELGKGCS